MFADLQQPTKLSPHSVETAASVTVRADGVSAPSSQNETSALLARDSVCQHRPGSRDLTLSTPTTDAAATTYGTANASSSVDASHAAVEFGDEIDDAKLVWWQHLLLSQAFSHTVGRAE